MTYPVGIRSNVLFALIYFMTTDDEILRQLIHQVSKAKPKGGNETAVTTYVTRPMWKAWCRAAGIPEDSEPTEWNGCHTCRVYGSKTIIIESEQMAAISFANDKLTDAGTKTL